MMQFRLCNISGAICDRLKQPPFKKKSGSESCRNLQRHCVHGCEFLEDHLQGISSCEDDTEGAEHRGCCIRYAHCDSDCQNSCSFPFCSSSRSLTLQVRRLVAEFLEDYCMVAEQNTLTFQFRAVEVFKVYAQDRFLLLHPRTRLVSWMRFLQSFSNFSHKYKKVEDLPHSGVRTRCGLYSMDAGSRVCGGTRLGLCGPDGFWPVVVAGQSSSALG